MTGESYLVTGAGGFVGFRVCELLASRGHRVIGMVRGPVPALDRLGVETVRGDLLEAGEWASAVGRADVVVHCAGKARFGNGSEYEAANVLATANLLDALRRDASRLKRLVFVSTIGVLDRALGDSCTRALDEHSPLHPSSDYGRSKAAAEALVAASGLPYVLLRSALVVGAAMRADSHFAEFARWVYGRNPLARVSWPGRFSVVDVDDLAEAILLCATHPEAVGRTLLCAGEPVGVDEYFEMLKPATRLSLRALLPAFRMFSFAMPFKLKSMLLPALVADDSALRRLGWSPAIPASEALAPVVGRERARHDPESEPVLGQTAITGAASGLGRALTEQLAKRRSRLLLIDRDAEGLGELSRRFPHAVCLVVDLAHESAWELLLESPAWRAHPVAELYACAGFGRSGAFSRDSASAQADMVRVNLLARMRLAHAVISDMSRMNFGRIVLISSSSAFQPLPSMTVYAASNAALLLFGEGLSYELSGRGIHVMTVCPGGMDTNFQRNANVRRNPGETLLRPEAVAVEIMRGLSLRKTTHVVSTRARMMALLARLLPRTWSLRLWGRLMAVMR